MERSAELEALVKDMYAAMGRGDLQAWETAMSGAEEILMIGTDPDEWWEGRDTVREAFRGQAEAMGGIQLVPGDPRAYVEGDVGWIADRPSFRLPDGREIATRISGVLRREDGQWRWVQAHFSIGIPNEDAFGQELPT